MNDMTNNNEQSGSRRVRLGPNAMRIAELEGGEDISAQSLDAAIARLEDRANKAEQKSHSVGSEADDARIERILKYMPEIQSNMVSIRYLIALKMATGPEDLKEIERRINDFLDRTETRLIRENGKKRPDLAELARAMFGNARADAEMKERDRMRTLEKPSDRER